MTSRQQWFRLHGDFLEDEAIMSLAFEDQRHFVAVMVLKCNGTLDREYPSEGARERVIARKLGLDLATAEEVRRRLAEWGLVGVDWQPANWDKRQYKSDASSAERVRRHRAKKRAEAKASEEVTGGVTPCNGYTVTPETESDTDTESEDATEASTSSVPIQKDRSKKNMVADAGASAPPRRRAKRGPLSHFVPDDWEPTEADVAWCKAEHPAVDSFAAFQRFCDHEFDKPRSDWSKTFRNWIRQEARFARRSA